MSIYTHHVGWLLGFRGILIFIPSSISILFNFQVIPSKIFVELCKIIRIFQNKNFKNLKIYELSMIFQKLCLKQMT